MDVIRLLATLVAALTLSTTVWAQYQPTQPVAELARNNRAPQIPTRITNNPDFGIPFEMASNQRAVAEVQLHVSTDQGARWQMYQKRAPGADGFQFRANNDGEYWFAVRTIDRGQDPRDFNQAQLQPELKVLVDTKKPQLDIRVNVDPSGQATAEWQAQDQNLVASSFLIQYQDQAGRWQDVPVNKPDERDLRNRWQGQTQFWVRTRGEEAAVRAEIVDRAGNSKLINKRVSLTGGPNNTPANSGENSNGSIGQSWPDFASGIRDRLPSFLRGVQQTDNSFGASNPRNWANLEPNESAPRRTEPQFEPSRAHAGTIDVGSRSGSFEQRNRNQIPDYPTSNYREPDYRDRSNESFAINRNYQGSGNRPNNYDSDNRASSNRRFEDRAAGNRNFANRNADRNFSNRSRQQNELRQSDQRFQDPLRRASRSDFDGPVARQRPQGTASGSQERMFQPRITASPNFELVYDLYGIDNRPQRVELWFTQDRGRTWEAYGADADQQSPMEVRVKQQGLYGFQLLVDAGRGNVPDPPRAGDDADVWVVVDWTKPTGTITRVDMPNGADSRDVTIEWMAEDTLLADTPITLSYSDNAEGPWTPLTRRSIPNSGAYQWRVDRRLPQRLYIQLEVRDMAGNVTSHVSDSRGGATGRILDVRPLSN